MTNPTARERAEKIVWRSTGSPGSETVAGQMLINDIELAILSAEEAAREECAKMAENKPSIISGEEAYHHGAEDWGELIAASIRARGAEDKLALEMKNHMATCQGLLTADEKAKQAEARCERLREALERAADHLEHGSASSSSLARTIQIARAALAADEEKSV